MARGKGKRKNWEMGMQKRKVKREKGAQRKCENVKSEKAKLERGKGELEMGKWQWEGGHVKRVKG